MKQVRAIAFYLPQFYPTPENDEWWEPGFTEWTNVARAKPLYKGHYQPRIPRDLGFYDLRVPETREKQAQLAREAGIEGFCYWHYWFGNGKRLLADVFREVVESGKPDFPFCLCWANHSWYQKTWDPTKPDKILVEQTYPGVGDYTAHFMEMLPAFRDKRYMRTDDGGLLFGFFDPHSFTDFESFKNTWNALAKQYNIGHFCFFALIQGEPSKDKESIERKYDILACDKLPDVYRQEKYGRKGRWYQRTIYRITRKPRVVKYTKYVSSALNFFTINRNVVPIINPDFDHSPRSGGTNIILHGSTPRLWGDFCGKIVHLIRNTPTSNLLFIKAWNEWGEGNYLEPDRKWGKDYLIETRNAILYEE